MARVEKQPRLSYAAAAVAGSSTAIIPGTGTGTGTGNDSYSEKKPDWAQLLSDLVRKIGDDLLRDDVADYICLRAVCQPWRRATDDPSALEPRFFPRNWLMLASGYELATNGVAERFVNVRTGAFLQIRLPMAVEYTHHGNTEGLLILHHILSDTVCLLNPLTMAFTELPSFYYNFDQVVHSAEFMPEDIKAAGVLVEVDEQGRAKSSQPPNVVLSLTSQTRTVLVYATPGDFVWQLVDTSCTDDLEGKLPTIKRGLSVWGRFYIPTRGGDVLAVVLQPRPHLTFVARQTGSSVCSGLSESSYLVPCGDDHSKDGMVLVRKKGGIQVTYLVWDVDLQNRRLNRITELSDMTVMLPSITLRSSTFPTICRIESATRTTWKCYYVGT